MQSAISSSTATAQFSGLVATTYTLRAVVMNAGSCICVTDCLSVSLAPSNEDCCSSLDVFLIYDAGSAPDQLLIMFAAIPSIQLTQFANIPFKLKYEWFSSFQPSLPVLGGQMPLSIIPQLPFPTDFTVYGRGPDDLGCASCCGCGFSATNLPPNGTCIPDPELFPLKITQSNPTSAFACDGSIEAVVPASPAPYDSVIYCMTDDNFNTVSILGDPTTGVTFSNLAAGNYYVYAIGLNNGFACICSPIQATLTAPMNASLTICQVSNPLCNYVDLIAISTNSANSPCLIQDFVWYMLDSSGNPCVIGTGPVMRVANSGTYMVSATISKTEPGCSQSATCESQTICFSSDPAVVTLGSCGGRSCSVQFSLCGTNNVCYNPEDQQPFLLCVVLPEGDTATYTYAWSVNGTPLPGETNPFVQIVPTNGIGTYEVCSQITDTATQCVSTSCISCTLNRPPMVTVPDQCVCTGAELLLEVTAAATSVNCCFNPAAQLFVTGPACFSFSSPITIGGTATVPVTGFATEANSGCYYAAVADANGCVGTNFGAPARVIVVPCCPFTS